MLFWGYGGGGFPDQTTFAPGGISNQSIGWEEQLETKILTDFIADLDPTAAPLNVTTTPAGQVQSFALASTTNLVLYLTHGQVNLNLLITNATVTLTVPTNNMQGEWIDPQSGALLATIAPNAGSQTLAVPGFATDVALRLQTMGTQPELRFSASSYSVNSSQFNVVLTVYRLGGTGGPARVNYATGDGLAIAGLDYTPAAGTLSWTSGDVMGFACASVTLQTPQMHESSTVQTGTIGLRP